MRPEERASGSRPRPLRPLLERTGEERRPPDPDTALVEGLRRGGSDAIERLMERHAARTYRLVRHITQSDADAEEVVQDVFVSVYRYIGTFETRARLGTWLYRIAVNAALLKRRGRHAAAPASLEERPPARGGDADWLLPDWASRPDVEFTRREARLAVRRALRALPRDYQAVVRMREFEELTNEEAARALGESVAAVKSRLHRARMALRARLDPALASGT